MTGIKLGCYMLRYLIFTLNIINYIIILESNYKMMVARVVEVMYILEGYL